jgi:uncharacterized protein YehS (DUF1456 family)
MDNNYIFYKLRKTFNWNEEKINELYRSVEYVVSPLDIFAWMKQDIYPGFKAMPDEPLAALLNGFIIERRGKKDGEIPVAESKLNNNIIFRKLKIALSLRDEDIVEIMALADMRIGKAELNAFFRDPKHSHYRPCKDQFLRNFIRGMQIRYSVPREQ